MLGGDSINWSLPLARCLKINFDGAFDRKTGKGSIGVIIRNNVGSIVDGFSGSCEASFAFMIEAFAFRRALIMLVCLGLDNFCVDSDCLELVNAVRDGGSNVY